MRIHIKALRRIIREVAEFSALNVKPGMTLRYTGNDMEKPNVLKVLKVMGDPDTGAMTITAGDKTGAVHKLSEKDLHAGEYEVVKLPPKPAPPKQSMVH